MFKTTRKYITTGTKYANWNICLKPPGNILQQELIIQTGTNV